MTRETQALLLRGEIPDGEMWKEDHWAGSSHRQLRASCRSLQEHPSPPKYSCTLKGWDRIKQRKTTRLWRWSHHQP